MFEGAQAATTGSSSVTVAATTTGTTTTPNSTDPGSLAVSDIGRCRVPALSIPQPGDLLDERIKEAPTATLANLVVLRF